MSTPDPPLDLDAVDVIADLSCVLARTCLALKVPLDVAQALLREQYRVEKAQQEKGPRLE
jgi:hypothetical protein